MDIFDRSLWFERSDPWPELRMRPPLLFTFCLLHNAPSSVRHLGSKQDQSRKARVTGGMLTSTIAFNSYGCPFFFGRLGF